MTSVNSGIGVPEESVAKVLELQSRYGMDQETMLIYISSVNLMNILNLISRRYQGPNVSLPVPAVNPALPPVTASPAQGSSPSLDNVLGALMKMVGSGNTQGGQSINPATLMSLLGALGGQNLDLGNLMNMIGGLGGSGAKPVQKPEANASPSAGAGSQSQDVKIAGEKAAKRDVPKIMKWDSIEDRKKS